MKTKIIKHEIKFNFDERKDICMICKNRYEFSIYDISRNETCKMCAFLNYNTKQKIQLKEDINKLVKSKQKK